MVPSGSEPQLYLPCPWMFFHLLLSRGFLFTFYALFIAGVAHCCDFVLRSFITQPPCLLLPTAPVAIAINLLLWQCGSNSSSEPPSLNVHPVTSILISSETFSMLSCYLSYSVASGCFLRSRSDFHPVFTEVCEG